MSSNAVVLFLRVDSLFSFLFLVPLFLAAAYFTSNFFIFI